MADDREELKGGCAKGCLWVVAVFILFVLFSGVVESCGEGPPPAGRAVGPTPAERARANGRRQEATAAAEERRKGFHCLSAWDGRHPTFARLVRENLNDPGSFKHVETGVSPVHEGEYGPQHRITMKFRANNQYGALMLGEARGVYLNEDCESVRVESIE